jgi:hypothetical protein
MVAGLGIRPGGHCTDDVSAPHTAHVAAISAAGTAAFATTAAPATSTPRHHETDPRGPSGKPSTTADECHIAPSTIVTTTVNTAAPLLPAEERSAVVASRPHSLTPCFSPGVALIHLGVSRT